MKTPLGTEVDLGPGYIVLDGVPALHERDTGAPPLFGPCLLWPRSSELLSVKSAEQLFHSLIVLEKEFLYSVVDADI